MKPFHMWVVGGIVGALWGVSMFLAGSWGARIDARLASIDETLTRSAQFQGGVEATLRAHEHRLSQLENKR